jgi:outer membrane protein TolC
MESQVFLEVRQAYTQTSNALQRIGVADQAVRQAEEALRIVADRYNGGLLTIVDLLTAEAALQQARTAQARARHDATVGKTHLRLAAGLLEEK